MRRPLRTEAAPGRCFIRGNALGDGFSNAVSHGDVPNPSSEHVDSEVVAETRGLRRRAEFRAQRVRADPFNSELRRGRIGRTGEVAECRPGFADLLNRESGAQRWFGGDSNFGSATAKPSGDSAEQPRESERSETRGPPSVSKFRRNQSAYLSDPLKKQSSTLPRSL